MEQHTKDLIDSYVSSKILTDPKNKHAMSEVLRDPAFQALKRQLDETGMFHPDKKMFIARLLVIHLILLASIGWMMPSSVWSIRILGMVLTAFAVVQGIFVAHEGDHGAITKNKLVVEIIGQYLMTVFSGYCFGYFRRTHALHHYHCQEEDCDPDAQFGLFSMTERAAEEKRGIGRFLTRHQVILVPLLLPLWSFDMKRESMAYVFRNLGRKRNLVVDAGGLILHFAFWFGFCSFYFGIQTSIVCYVGWVAFAGVYLGIIIPINHLGTSTIQSHQNLCFVEQQIITSRNISGHWILDFLFIGLNRQIEHHLFPWASSTRLRLGGDIVKRFCHEQGLPYRELSFFGALRELQAHFRRIAMRTNTPSKHMENGGSNTDRAPTCSDKLDRVG